MSASSAFDKDQAMSLLGRQLKQKPANLASIATPGEAEEAVKSLKSPVETSNVDAAYPTSWYIKVAHIVFGLLCLAAGVTFLAIAWFKPFNVPLGSTLPNLGRRSSDFNLFYLVGFGVGAIGLAWLISLFGIFWTPAMVGIYEMRISGLRLVLGWLQFPILVWTTAQILGVTDVFLIIALIVIRLAAAAFQYLSEFINKYWMDALMQENGKPASKNLEEADYTIYSELFASLMFAAEWVILFIYAVEIWVALTAPASTALAIPGIFVGHLWLIIVIFIVAIIMDIVMWLAHFLQYVANYMDDNTWQESLFQTLRKPHYQENIQLIAKALVLLTIIVCMFIALYV